MDSKTPPPEPPTPVDDVENVLPDKESQPSTPGPSTPPLVAFSMFTKVEKRLIITVAAYAACFSTLSSFIYYPALDLMASSLSVSVDKINLTVTSYMAVATIAPTLVGDFADVLGRRPAYILCLTLYIAANIAIALAKSWGALLGLRVLQALGISGVISLAYGVVADIATPAERGSFVSAIGFGVSVAPTLGPILGGALAWSAGWTWIFWFLVIAAGAALVLVVFFLPETSRSIVGDGSVPPPTYLRLPLPKVMAHYSATATPPSSRPKRMPNPLRSLTILLRRDNIPIMLAIGLLYAVYTVVNSAISVLFIEVYKLNQLQAGLIYIPFGVGSVVSTFISGPMLDGAYKRARIARGMSTDRAVGDDLDEFPIERARIGVVWTPLAATILSVLAFGWTLHYHVHIAAPLAMQFIAGLAMQLVFSTYNTLLVDKNHRTPAAAQASSNVVRCAMAAVIMVFLQDMIDAMGIGGTFSLMAGLCVVIGGLFLIDYRFGMAWRQQWVRKQNF